MVEGLAGRVGLVTGAASGIGRASAVRLAQAGARLLVTDLSSRAEAGAETVAMIASTGGEASFLALDVTQSSDWAAAMSWISSTYGTLDFAHNNAGIGQVSPFVEATHEDFARVMDVNVLGVWLGMQHELRAMADTGGSIVNTASLAGLRGLELGAIYSASKHAVLGLTRSAAVEYGNRGIRVNAVCPAAVDTEMTAGLSEDLRRSITAPQAISRFAQPVEVAEAVAWLCSPDSSFITGVALPVDAGATAG